MSDKVVQFSAARKEKQDALKREYERFLFHKFLGCYTVIEKIGLQSAEVVDISRTGCGFRTPSEMGAFQVGEEVDFRFYFSSKNYLPMKLKIQRVEKQVENHQTYWVYGCSFDTELSTYPAIVKFVEFIEEFSATAKEDLGPRKFGL